MPINYWGNKEEKEISLKIKQNFWIFMEKVEIITDGILNWIDQNTVESQLINIRKKATVVNKENKDEYLSQIEEYERWVNDQNNEYERYLNEKEEDMKENMRIICDDDYYFHMMSQLKYNDEDDLPDCTNIDVDCTIEESRNAYEYEEDIHN